MDRLAWLRERQTGVGASDAPVLAGVGYGDRTPADLYRSKVGPVDERPPAGRLLRGVELEPVVARMYAEATGNDFRPCDPVVRHPENDWQIASLDRVTAAGRPVELKTTQAFGDGWGQPGSGEVPDSYWVQVQHQMGVFGADFADLAALNVCDWELRVYRVAFDRGFFEALTEVEAEFWAKVVLAEPPAAGWEPPSAAALRQRVTAVEAGTTADLGTAGETLAYFRRQWQEKRDVAEAQVKRLTGEIEQLMGGAETASAGEFTLKRRFVQPSSFTVNRKGYWQLDVRAPKGRKGGSQ